MADDADTPRSDDQPDLATPLDGGIEDVNTADEVGRARDPRVLAGAALIAVLVVVGAVFLFTRGGDEVAAPTTTTATTSPTSTTTTVVVRLPENTFEIATVKPEVERVVVRADAPDDWASSESAVVHEVEMELPPASRDSAPDRPAIPTIDGPVVGRYATEDGWEFSNPGPIDPDQLLTMLVNERRGDWVQVMLSVRPNQTVGYVRATDVEISTINTRIEINLGEHKLTAYDGNDMIVESQIVAGVNFSPTPTGTFFLTDIMPQKNPGGSYGPFILPTNGYSELLNEFDDGVPVIAIHGTNNPSLLGQDRSNGCIRVPNDVITKLAETMPPGTPVLIWP